MAGGEELAEAWIITLAPWKWLQGHTQVPGQSRALWSEDPMCGLVWEVICLA